MTSSARWKYLLLLGLLTLSTAASAITPEEDERDKKCIKPKFRDFSPADKAEVAPGSPMGFHVSHTADPASIAAEAKGHKIKLNVKDRKTFYEVTGSLPSELSNTFARISLHAKAAEGECMSGDGWLIKIKAAGENAVAAPASETPQQTTETEHSAQ